MIKITKNKRKNPTNFYKDLEKLVGKTVVVRVNHPSDNFYFAVEGILKHEFLFSVHTKVKNHSATIYFNEKMIIKISNNFIDIKLIPKDKILEEILQEITNSEAINLEFFIDKIIAVSIPGQVRWPYILGKLKYNKKDKFYYIQSFDHTIQIKFIKDMVFNIKNHSIEILSESINNIRK